ncbi:hypothetical protein BGZ83_003975 [Gryganskiella cystojenkinii]|nr:hypothetical protein BGZ83_003975 [Gryganskiella cystojenkinii]
MASDEVNYLILEYIFCIVAILNNLNESILVLVYDGRVMALAGGTLGCTISGVLEQFLPLVLTCLAMIMGFHIWFVIVRRSKYTERQLLKWYCLGAFGIPAILTSIACILLRDKDYLSAYPRKYYCEFAESEITFWTFAVPMMAIAIPGILCTGKKKGSRDMARTTAPATS